MTIPKKYLQDRLILLMLSINVFLACFACLGVLLKLDSGRSAGYIVEYRAPLGVGLKAGGANELVAFVGFALMVLIIHAVLSIRAYPIKREVSIVILGFSILLLVMSAIVSNALLALR